jgi:Flp pilus assembly protein TadG
MSITHLYRFARRHPRGSAAVMFGLMIPMLMGFVALALDTAVLALARAQMSTAADSAALAGAQQLADDARLTGTSNIATEIANANTKAQSFGEANLVLNQAPLVNLDPNNNGSGDIVVGYLDPNNPSSTLDTNAADSAKFNAVQVTIKRSSDHVAPIPTFFGQVMGFQGTAVTIKSTAMAQNYTIKGFKSKNNLNAQLLPIVLDQTTYNNMIQGLTQDNYTWNESTQTVSSGPDGVTESVLYPVGSGSPGNWGTIKVGVSNNSTSVLSAQIQYGITPAQLATFPNSTIQLDYTQTPPQIIFSGNPGISAGIKSAIDAIIGKPVTIPIYDTNGGNGNNAWYRVVQFACVRILAENFQGNPKYVIVQPALVRDPTATAGSAQSSWSSGGLVELHIAR